MFAWAFFHGSTPFVKAGMTWTLWWNNMMWNWNMVQWQIPIAPVPVPTRTCEFPRSLLQPWTAVACDRTFLPFSWQNVWPDIGTRVFFVYMLYLLSVRVCLCVCSCDFIFRYDVIVCLRICALTYCTHKSCYTSLCDYGGGSSPSKLFQGPSVWDGKSDPQNQHILKSWI